MTQPQRRDVIVPAPEKGIMRRGVTLIEILVILVVVGALCGIAVPRLLRHLERTHVRHATREVVATLATARATAMARRAHVAAHFDVSRSTVVVVVDGDTIAVRAIGDVHGVRLHSNRDSTAYGPDGLGYGAANQTVVISRGRASDSVVISRLGRVRW